MLHVGGPGCAAGGAFRADPGGDPGGGAPRRWRRACGAQTFGVRAYAIKANPEVRWQDWRLILDGQEYRSPFAGEHEWRARYRRERDADWEIDHQYNFCD